MTYPVNPNDNLPELIVCAANKDPETQVVYPCVRHGCEIFWGLIDAQFPHGSKKVIHFEQGFLTNKYRFVSRKEAWDIAIQQKQIKRLCPTGSTNPNPKLFSEMLY